MRNLSDVFNNYVEANEKLMSLRVSGTPQGEILNQQVVVDRLQRELDYTFTECRYSAIKGTFWNKGNKPGCSCGGG